MARSASRASPSPVGMEWDGMQNRRRARRILSAPLLACHEQRHAKLGQMLSFCSPILCIDLPSSCNLSFISLEAVGGVLICWGEAAGGGMEGWWREEGRKTKKSTTS